MQQVKTKSSAYVTSVHYLAANSTAIWSVGVSIKDSAKLCRQAWGGADLAARTQRALDVWRNKVKKDGEEKERKRVKTGGVEKESLGQKKEKGNRPGGRKNERKKERTVRTKYGVNERQAGGVGAQRRQRSVPQRSTGWVLYRRHMPSCPARCPT
ncbi:hypothetical protein B0H12DRAFT_1081600 [Mycena haematopus]|nr:hypothetical protein B0H12DRAFT_1081600 [Mycena haematopus]